MTAPKHTAVRRFAEILLLASMHPGCLGGEPPTTPPGTASWDDTAVSHRGHDGERFTYRCPIGCPSACPYVGTVRPVWGTDVYTDDSSVCTAAAHVGVITFQSGGSVTIEIRPGQARYVGSSRNDVSSRDSGPTPGSFVFP